MCFFKRKTVLVRVCNESNLLPNPYCPIVVEKRFYKGEEPKTTCAVHHAGPIDPPWPAKADIPIYAFVPELMVAKGDINAYLKKIRMAGAWGIRFFLLQSWSTFRLVPWLQAEYGGESVRIVIPEEGLDTPVTDLTKSNPAYWSRLATILALIKANDLEAVVSLGDNCSMNTHAQFLSYPFLSALQTMSREEIWPYVVPQGATTICEASRGGLYGPDKYPWFQEWIASAIDALNASGCPYRMEIQNEFDRKGWTDDTPERWYKMCLDAAGSVRLINSGDYLIIGKYGGTYSQHGVARAAFNLVPGIPHDRILLSGDGAQGNSETDTDVMGRRGLSVADAKVMAVTIEDEGLAGYEWMQKTIWSEDDALANVDYGTGEIIEAMRDAVK